MKSFVQFLEEKKKKKVVVVDVLPVHGEHAQTKKNKKKLKESTIVDTPPVHGEHSKPKKLDEFLDHNPNEHLGKTFEEVNNTLSKHYDHKDLSEDHRNAVNDYTDYSGSHNSHLINKETGKESDVSDVTKGVYDRRTKHLNDMISKQKAPKEYTVFHGTGFDPDKFASQSSDRTIKIPAFTSTSTNPATAARFARDTEYKIGSAKHILRIKIPEGSSISRHIGSNSQFPKEHETLMKNGVKLKIDEKPELYHNTYENNPDYRDGTYHVWNATVQD